MRYDWPNADGPARSPYRLHIHSHEPNEPPHVHVDRDDEPAKFWLSPVALARNVGFRAHELREIERPLQESNSCFWRLGMGITATRADERVHAVTFTEDTFTVELKDGRAIMTPLAWFPRLLHATPAQRENWHVSGGGYGVHWPDVDEDISTEGLLRGAPAPRGTIPQR